MALESWDPLAARLSAELVTATIKRRIKNILRSYTGWFDPFCELIQNALDAVDKRKQRDEEFEPTIWIRIDLKENTISVTDNGVGFLKDEFIHFLAPDVTFKALDERGNKGVGATYLAYGYNFLQVGTKTSDFSFVGEIKAGREWVEEEVTRTRPKIEQSRPIHDAFNDIDQGSTFSLKLTGKYVHPSDLKWIGATNADQWEVVLRVKTALGGIYFDRQCLLSKCYLTVVDDNGQESEKVITNCKYLYPHTVVSGCKELNNIKSVQEELRRKGKDVSKLPDDCYRLNGLYNFWTYQDIVLDKGEFSGVFDSEEKKLAEKYKLSFYGYFGYSTDIWDKYNDGIVGLRKNARILKGGLQLASNSMPQGDLLVIPLTKNVWYQNISHVLIHFEKAEPDLGRKGFQPELKNLGLSISAAVVKKFQGWRRHLKKDTGAPPDIAGARNIHDWIRDQEEHEKKHPLIIKRKDVFLPMREASMTSEPLNEQDVVSLFNQLLAGGVIRGVKLMATSQYQQYDGICRLRLKEPFENHIFGKNSNPLGIEESNARTEFESSPLILEYKYSFDGLFEEIEKEEKNERQIGLVVAWEMGMKWSKRYEITPLLYFETIQHRYFHGGTHIIKDTSTGDIAFPAIILSELIDYINDPDGVQDYQRNIYMEQ